MYVKIWIGGLKLQDNFLEAKKKRENLCSCDDVNSKGRDGSCRWGQRDKQGLHMFHVQRNQEVKPKANHLYLELMQKWSKTFGRVAKRCNYSHSMHSRNRTRQVEHFPSRFPKKPIENVWEGNDP